MMRCRGHSYLEWNVGVADARIAPAELADEGPRLLDFVVRAVVDAFDERDPFILVRRIPHPKLTY